MIRPNPLLDEVLQLLKMAPVGEQRVCNKFCCKLKQTATETFQMLVQAFEDGAILRDSDSGNSMSPIDKLHFD